MWQINDMHLAIWEMKLLDLFDDVPYKYIKYNNYDSDNFDDDVIMTNIKDLPYDREDWCKTRFTFELYGYTFPDGDDEWKEFVVEKVYRQDSTYQNNLFDILGFNEEEEAEVVEVEAEEEESDEEEHTLTNDKYDAFILFMIYINCNAPYSKYIKEKICGSDELAKQFKIIKKLSQKAIDDNDIELWKKMDKKRKEIVYKIMDNIEDIKNDITEIEFLKVCNYLKSIF
jgi:hypothetical protein